MTNLEAVKTLLERSGAVPLNVDFLSVNRDLIQVVVPHAHRFQRLSVSVRRGPYDPFTYFTNPAPCSRGLRSITLREFRSPFYLMTRSLDFVSLSL